MSHAKEGCSKFNEAVESDHEEEPLEEGASAFDRAMDFSSENDIVRGMHITYMNRNVIVSFDTTIFD